MRTVRLTCPHCGREVTTTYGRGKPITTHALPVCQPSRSFARRRLLVVRPARERPR